MSRFPRVKDVLSSERGQHVILGVDYLHDTVELLEVGGSVTEHCSYRQLRKELASGTTTSSSAKMAAGIMQKISHASPAYKKFLFRDALVRKVQAIMAQGGTKASAILSLSGTEIKMVNGDHAPMCSQREAYRIISSHKLSGQVLPPAYASRGNKKDRYGERMVEIILQLVESEFAKPKSKLTLVDLTQAVSCVARAEGILQNGAKVSRKFVRSVILKHWNPDLDHKRLDPRMSKSLKAVAGNRIRAGAPLNRVEIDTLHLPFLAKCDYGIAEDIRLMHAIDCETSLPLSWWLMLTAPTTEDTFICLGRAIYPKAELLDSMGIMYEVDPYGGILNLVWDNGPENSRHRMAAITRVGINPLWTEADSGNQKPFVERLNRSLKEALQALPGCTRFNGKDGARTEAARKEKLLTIQELEHWIVRWLFEKWPHTPLDRFITADYEVDEDLGGTPALRWRNYEKRFALPICPTREDWQAVRYLEERRPLSNKTGISYEGFHFRGDNLKLLILQYGSGTEVTFRYNPHDYRTIFVANKVTGEWIPLVNCEVTSKTPAYSFDEAKKRRKVKKAAVPRHPASDQFDIDITENILGTTKKSMNRTEKRRDAHNTIRIHQAVKRAAGSPLPAAAPTASSPDSYIADDAIPTFGTSHKTPRPKR